MKNRRYGITSLRKQFPNDEACLEFIFDALHPRTCVKKGRYGGVCGGTFNRIEGRRQFQCSTCRSQIAPTAGTIFNKSATPLTLWFHAILVFLNAKGAVSAKQLERDLEITYKCAWRILSLIRWALQGYFRLHSRNTTFSAVVVMVANARLQNIHRKKRRGIS